MIKFARLSCLIVAAGLIVGAVACKKSEPSSDDGEETAAEEKTEAESKPAEAQSPLARAKQHLDQFEPLPDKFPSEDNPITPAKVELGRMLYYEKRISKSNEVSCNTCHPLDEYGVDRKETSIGHKDREGPRNAPTVYNAANQIAQFWDGRAEDVEEQAKGPVLNPKEMGMPNQEEVESFLRSVPGYVDKFEEAFPKSDEPVTFDHMAQAIGAFERKLSTPSKWDAFLEGDEDALSREELKGFNTFVEAGCPTCHNGARVGGQMYQKLGLVEEYPDQSDLGRYKVTDKESDKMKFKVPILRNVTKTQPYFHDGSVETLEEAVEKMGKYQLGEDLSDDQIDSIVTWLETLTGDIPEDYIEKPELPELE